jgi:hypothetical protein
MSSFIAKFETDATVRARVSQFVSVAMVFVSVAAVIAVGVLQVL